MIKGYIHRKNFIQSLSTQADVKLHFVVHKFVSRTTQQNIVAAFNKSIKIVWRDLSPEIPKQTDKIFASSVQKMESQCMFTQINVQNLPSPLTTAL